MLGQAEPFLESGVGIDCVSATKLHRNSFRHHGTFHEDPALSLTPLTNHGVFRKIGPFRPPT